MDESPELYLDEIATELIVRKDCYLSLAKIRTILRERIGYSLQVCYDSALQRNEVERLRYKQALRFWYAILSRSSSLTKRIRIEMHQGGGGPGAKETQEDWPCVDGFVSM